MLALDKSQMIEGLMVYADAHQVDTFYVVPDQPRIRIDDTTKKPVFTFVKYKMPVDNKDGSKGGGFLIFDSYFVVPDDKQKKIQDALDQQLQALGYKDASGQPMKAKLGRMTYSSGTASLTLLDSGGALVSKIESVGKPSLFGSMICSYTAALTPEGATVVEALLKKSGGVAQVAYDLHTSAMLPPIRAHVWFHATKFYSFYQTVDKSGGSWDSANDTEKQTQRQNFIDSDSGGVWFDFAGLNVANADQAQKTREAITNWGWAQLDAATKDVLPEIKPSEDKGDDGKDHFTRDESTFESKSFDRWFKEQDAVDFHIIPQGTLPNVVDMGFDWKDFMVEVDANDPFFAQIHASVNVNADFDKFMIDSVDVQCEYSKGKSPTVDGYHFVKADDVGKFDSDTVNGDMNYSYSFTVNYKDQSKPYASPAVATDNAQVTINANQLGILYVDLVVGSVDFDKTPQVQVALRYPDADASGHPVSRQFNFTTDKKQDSMVAVLLKDVDKPYEYQITYIMKDGSQIATDWIKQTTQDLYINSPFVNRTFSFLAEADFDTNVDNIFLKMDYKDAVNHVDQNSDFTFTKANQSKDWTLPVVAGAAGTITYSGVITYKNHTTETIPPTDTDRDLIEFGPPNQVIVSVVPDATLIDFSQVKLVKVDMEYKDADNQIDLKHEFLLKDAAGTPAAWTFYARDPSKTSYSYTATYYLAGTPPKVVQAPSTTSTDTDLILMMPA